MFWRHFLCVNFYFIPLMQQNQSPILEILPSILAQVESPARYIGGEANSVYKPAQSLTGTCVLLFPDLYEIGMSNNSYRILYHVVNAQPDLLAELAYAPWPDMAALLQQHKVPLYSHQSYKPIATFDVVGITLQTELNFTNVPYVLELGNIPAWACERTDAHPFVIGGGPAVANPEPVADFFDAFVVGDGEKLTPQIIRLIGDLRKKGSSRITILEQLHTLPGVYVPSLQPVVLNEYGNYVPQHPAVGPYERWQGVKRVFIETMDPNDYPRKNVIANMPLVHDRFAVELMRGCTNGCRFCQAGYWYRPSRELNADAVIEVAKEGLLATGERELGLLSLSSADYSNIESVTDVLIEDDFFHGKDVSLPSLRADAFGQSLARKVAAMSGGRSATFAPETGSARLRKAINKSITDEDMQSAAESVFSAGFTKIKLYTMVGFPTENLEDMEHFCGLIQKLVDIGKKYNRRAQIHANIGILIPKSFTPLQWAPFMEYEQAMEHIRFVRERFYKHPHVRITWADWKTARLESVYSRGGRELAPMIYQAYQKGMVFESDSNSLRHEQWEDIWQQSPSIYSNLSRERAHQEVFPWDFMHIGVTKGYLLREYKAFYTPESAAVPDCKWGDCNHCGIPGNGSDTQLAQALQNHNATTRSEQEIKELQANRRKPAQNVYFYRLEYRKRGLSAFLAHRNTLNAIEKAFLATKVALHFSSGFSPKPKIHNPGALALGLESESEYLIFETTEKLSPDYVQSMISQWESYFPAGMQIKSITQQSKRGMDKPPWIEYVLLESLGTLESLETEKAEKAEKAEIIKQALAVYAQQKVAPVVNHRGRSVDVQQQILSVHWQPVPQLGLGNKLVIKAQTNATGNSVSPYILFAGLLGVPEKQVRTMRLLKWKEGTEE
jgi:radical SAM family uncharacterized protein/radical SAM-linked protein